MIATGDLALKASNRVLRGGSWNNNGRNVRSAYRNHNEPDNRNNNTGFRLSQLTPCQAAGMDQPIVLSAEAHAAVANSGVAGVVLVVPVDAVCKRSTPFCLRSRFKHD